MVARLCKCCRCKRLGYHEEKVSTYTVNLKKKTQVKAKVPCK
jgi:DNA-binding CsgD family transcriptional regulator